MLLSGTQIVLGPGTDLNTMGFNQLLGSSYDMFQPHVSVAVSDAGQSLGPYGQDPTGEDQNNLFLLDSGANDISVVGTVAQQLIDSGLTSVGKFKDSGAGGSATYNLSSPYEVDFTGSDSVTHVLPQTSQDVRILTSTTFSFGASVPGVLGMPAMINRVTTLDTSQQQNQNTLFGALGVTFSDTLPPSSTGDRFTVSTDTRVKFDPHAGLPAGSPADAPLPTWGDVNFVTATISYHGVSVTGSFVVDTGSQLSMLSHAMASSLGLNLSNPIDTLQIEGVGGTVNVPVMAIDTLGLTTDQGPDLVWKGNSSNPLGLGVLDIAPGIDGVLGADLLTAGLTFDMSSFDFSGTPYFNTISLDFRNVATEGTGKLVFDLNPQYYRNIDSWAGSAAGGDWNNAANWSAGTPSSGNLLLMQSSTPATMNNDLGNGSALGEISTDGSFTLAGNSVVLDAAGGVAIASVEGNSTFGLQTQLGSDGTVQVSAGQLSITAPLDNNAHQLTFDVAAGAKGLVTGSITGAGGLLKTGGGTVTLQGADSYTGGTAVTDGTLVAGAANTLSHSSDLIINGGTLDVTGSSQMINSLTVGSLGSLNLTIGNLLTSTGVASLNGVLNLFGTAGGTQELMSYPSYIGSFSSVSGIPSGYALKYNPTELDLVYLSTNNSNSILGVSTNSVSLGRVMLNNVPTTNVTISLTGGTSATGFSTSAGGGATVSASNNGPGAITSSQSGTVTVSLTNATGSYNGTVQVQNSGDDGTGNGPSSAGPGQGKAQSPMSISVTGTVADNRIVTATTTNLGTVHVGAAVAQPIMLSTSGGDNYFTRVTVDNAETDTNGISVTGGTNPVFNASTVTDMRTLNGVFSSVGTFNSSIILPTTGEGLPGESPINVPVSYTAQVFSGKAQWNLVGGGSWAANGNWQDAQAGGPNAGAPGISGIAGDTATFGNFIGSSAATVTIDGANPTLSEITFNNTTGGSFTLAQDTGGTLTLSNTPGDAIINVSGGSHQITAPVTVGTTTDVTVSNSTDTLVISGGIGGSGGLKKYGLGTLVIGGANTCSGDTTVGAGTFRISAMGSLGNTAISVANGATFAPMAGNGTVVAGSIGVGSVGATLNLNAGAVFDMTDGGAGIFSLNQQSGFVGTALTLSGATLKFDLSSIGADGLLVNNGAAAMSGTNTISITGLGSSLTPGGTYVLISASSGLNGTFVFPNNSTSEALAVGGTPYRLTLNSSGTAETVNVYGPTSYQLVATAANPIIIQGGSTTVTSTIQNTGTQANNVPLDYTGLSVSLAGNGSLTGLSRSGSGINPANSDSGVCTFTSGVPDTATLTPTVGSVTNTMIGGSVNGGNPVTAIVTVLGHAAPSLSVQSQPSTVIVGATGVGAVLELSNGGQGQSGLAALDVNSLGAGVGGPTGGALVASGSNQIYTAILNTDTLGTQTQTFSLSAGDDQTLPGASAPKNLSAGATLTVLDHAAGSVKVTSGSGFLVHAGATGLSATVSLNNAVGTRSDLEVDSAPTIGSGTLGNGPATTYYIPAGSAQAYTATFSAGTTSGAFSDTVTFASAGDNQSLPGANALGSLAVSIMGNVYSGQAVWNATTGVWGASANWKDSVGGGRSGAPGILGYATDTATFGPIVSSGVAAVALDGAAPVLSNLIFSNSNASYWILQGTGTTGLTLTGTNGGSPAAMTVISGKHWVDAPIVLGSNLVVSSSGSLTVSGNISDSGLAKSLTLDGDGELVLSGMNSYSGGTVVNAGTLIVTNGYSLADGGSLTVGAGGTFIFDSSLTVAASNTSVTTVPPVTANGVSSIPLSLSPTTLASSSVGTLSSKSFSDSAETLPIQSPRTVAASPIALPLQVSAHGLQTSTLGKPFSAGLSGTAAADQVVRSSTARNAAEDLAWLAQAANSSSNSDQQRKKEVAILALDAVFVQYER